MPEEGGSIDLLLGKLLAKVEGIEERLKRADESRQHIHERLDQLVIRTTHLEADVSNTKTSIDAMKGVTDDVVKLRQRVEGAGTMGRWLLRLAVASVGIAGWLVGLYTWLTGRPPP